MGFTRAKLIFLFLSKKVYVVYASELACENCSSIVFVLSRVAWLHMHCCTYIVFMFPSTAYDVDCHIFEAPISIP